MIASTRVVFNTSIQYLRSILSVIISLYTTRLVLKYLGSNDYGIYSLVGGVVAMLSFIKVSLASTTQRYLSFYQGKKDLQMQKSIFNNSVFTQFLISIAIITLLLLLQPYIFNKLLNIDVERIYAAKWVYRFMLISLFFTMQSTPYYATLISHENILFSTLVQIGETLSKIPIVIALTISTVDNLVLFSALSTFVQIVIYFVYQFYCKNKYSETRKLNIRLFNKNVFKDMFSFMGWVVYSTGCVVGRTQGLAIILNKFFSTAINAAYGISWHLSGQVSFLSSSLLNAINPQIIRAEGEQNRKRMFRLAEIASKFSFLLLAMITIPSIIEMKTLLTIWLKDFPEYTVMFCQFILLTNLADQLTIGLVTANKAIGNIKNYSITINTIKLLTVPTAFICLRIGLPVISVMISLLLFELICAISRLFFLKISGGLSIIGFIQRVFMYEIIPIAATVAVSLVISNARNSNISFLYTFFASFFVMGLTAYFAGLTSDEKDIVNTLLKIGINKLKKSIA